MKKIVFICLLSILADAGFSQITGGGDKATNKVTKTSSSGAGNSYFKLALTNPIGDFGNEFSIPTGTMSASSGFSSELGTMFYIDALEITNDLKLGIDVTYLSGSSFLFLGDEVSTGGGFAFAPKIGPFAEYSVSNDLKVSGFFKLMYRVGYRWVYAYNDDYDYDESGWGTKLNSTLGANIHYNQWIFGMEFEFGKLNYTMDYYSYYYGSSWGSYSGSTSYEYEAELPQSIFRLVAGLNF
jgi:hypothetical protein